jgi:hypothetical protein
MRVAVQATKPAEQLLIDHLAQAQPGNAASQGTGDGTEYSTRTDTRRPTGYTDLHTDAQTGGST